MGKKEPETLIAVGTITTPHGLRGELWVKPLTDDVNRFFDLKELYLLHPQEGPRCYPIKSIRVAPGPASKKGTKKEAWLLLSLEGIEGRTAAEGLVGYSLAIPASQARAPAPGTYFVHQIIGLWVEDESGQVWGQVVDIFSTAAHDIYVVKQGSREWYLPAAKEIIRRVDLDQGKLIIAPPPGLLEINE